MSKNNPPGHNHNLSLVFQSPPIYDVVFHHLSPLDLIHVSWTSKNAYYATRRYMARAFSINRLLSRFFKDPRAFRSLQARTGTLISGSQALQFFRRTFWAGSDLDIYTCRMYSMEVGLWLERQGYRFAPSTKQPTEFVVAASPLHSENLAEKDVIEWDMRNPIDVDHEEIYAITGIISVFSFEKEVAHETLKIQIIAAKFSPLQAILKFHSTAVMNFISWAKAYSLYPYATLQKSRSLICFMPDFPCPRYENALVKYHSRGFTMVADLYAHEDPRCAFRLGPRFVGDAHSWSIPLDIDGVLQPGAGSTGLDHYLSNGWSVERSSTSYKMDMEVIRSSVLRHTYVAPYKFVMYAVPFFVGQGRIEHAKLSRSALTYVGYGVPKPNFWKFYDEELVDMQRQWIDEGMPSVSQE